MFGVFIPILHIDALKNIFATFQICRGVSNRCDWLVVSPSWKRWHSTTRSFISSIDKYAVGLAKEFGTQQSATNLSALTLRLPALLKHLPHLLPRDTIVMGHERHTRVVRKHLEGDAA